MISYSYSLYLYMVFLVLFTCSQKNSQNSFQCYFHHSKLIWTFQTHWKFQTHWFDSRSTKSGRFIQNTYIDFVCGWCATESRNEMSKIVLNLCEYVLNLCEYVLNLCEYVQYSNYVENRVQICTHFFIICIYLKYIIFNACFIMK